MNIITFLLNEEYQLILHNKYNQGLGRTKQRIEMIHMSMD